MFILSSSHLRGPLSSERCVQKGVRRLSRRRYAIRSAKVGLEAYVGVTNESDTTCGLDSGHDISIQMTLLHCYLLPLETEHLVRLLRKGKKDSKEAAKDIQKNPW